MSMNSPYCCPQCGSGLSQKGERVRCRGCEIVYGSNHGVVDLLVNPSADVRQELVGLASENNIDVTDGFDKVKFMETAKIDSLADLMRRSQKDPTQYYQQTTSAYLEALSRAELQADLKVLEIGSERTYSKLAMIRQLCAEAYALNIFFHIGPDPQPTWPERVIADMKTLPFPDGYFDLVVSHATLHHSHDLSASLLEVSRVLARGGRAVVVNEPVEGAAKRWGYRATHTRDADIHEDPVSWGQWRSGIKASGLRPDFFLPAWFLDNLRNIDSLPKDTRVYPVARALSAVLASPSLRDAARLIGRAPGQQLLGLPLNGVLWK